MKIYSQNPAKLNKLTIIVGAAHDIYNRLSFYIGAAQAVMIFGVFYATVIIPTPALHWLSLPVFLLVIVCLLIVGAIITWKILIPLLMAYANYQSYKHSNPFRQDMASIHQDLDLIKKHIGIEEGK